MRVSLSRLFNFAARSQQTYVVLTLYLFNEVHVSTILVYASTGFFL